MMRWLMLIGCLLALSAQAADQLEFTNGTKVTGKLITFENAKKQLTFEFQFNGQQLKRTFAYAQVHALTWKGKRYVLTAKAGGGAKATRTKAEVEALIAQAGRTSPPWLNGTRLNYPKSLDLNWPQPAPKGWNSSKNVGQFLWDIINPNTSRWREGIRFMNFMMDRHKDNGRVRTRATKALANMYFIYLQDYARAAYWWRRAGAGKGEHHNTVLAECYFRLGNKDMAMDQLKGAPLRPALIKLYGTMGETDTAIRLAQRFGGNQALHANLLAGDACRLAGRTQGAIAFYRTVLAGKDNKGHAKTAKARARESIAALQLEQKAVVSRVADGTYRDQTTGYAGSLEVTVTVKGKRITDVKVTRHREKQFYSSIEDTTKQILAKQSVKGIDATSRATITSQAIVNAAAKALAKGAK